MYDKQANASIPAKSEENSHDDRRVSTNPGGLIAKEQQPSAKFLANQKRAWRIQEQGRRKSEAFKKKKEQEKHERQARTRASLGEQKKCDKFGFESSQLHLGAFLGRAQAGGVIATADDSDETMFNQELLDDDSLLEAMRTVVRSPSQLRSPCWNSYGGIASQHRLSNPRPAQPVDASLPHGEEDLDGFFSDLASSTQIAREIQNEAVRSQPKHDLNLSFSSFGSDFDLTVEDIEALEASIEASQQARSDQRLMPPPAFPSNDRTTSLRKPPLSGTDPEVTIHILKHDALSACLGSTASLDIGITMSQLETFVDDDLQLTQELPD